mmetsp:Transcript_48016/g.127167  ORF Transcript_48016/g.127167 Transcript_48016/m.127167 type:complete len:81 (+) Transcript_48016:800-1042(+)
MKGDITLGVLRIEADGGKKASGTPAGPAVDDDGRNRGMFTTIVVETRDDGRRSSLESTLHLQDQFVVGLKASVTDIQSRR